MHVSRLFTAVCLLGLSSLAHADTVQQFNATDINFYVSPTMPATTGTLTGGIVVNTTTGNVLSSTLQYNAVGGAIYNFSTITQQNMAGVTEFFAVNGPNGSSLGFYIPGTYVNYAGGQTCYYPSQASCTVVVGATTYSESTFVQLGAGSYVYASSGGLTSANPVVAATPEPSSLLLLSTGALSLVGVVRRRVMRTGMAE